MKRFLLLFFMVLWCPNIQAEPFAYQILGHDFSDTATLNADLVFEQVLQFSPQFQAIGNRGEMALLRKQENKSLVFFIALALLYVFASVRLMFAHQFSGSFAILKNINDKRKQATETDQISSWSFYTLYLITVGYLTYYFLQHYGIRFVQLPPLIAILISITGVTLLYVLKVTLMFLLAWTFDKKSVLTQYFQNVSVVYKITAIVLFPLSIMILVSGSTLSVFLLKLAVLIVVISVIFRYIRNFGMMKKLLSMHFLHFFVYLCAFEIMPLLLLYRLIR